MMVICVENEHGATIVLSYDRDSGGKLTNGIFS